MFTRSILLATLLFVTNACSIPRRDLSVDEKTTDLYWVFSKFGESYAPLTYKEGLFGFSYSQLKQKYLGMITPEQSNEEFYHSVHSFIATFKDAHTHAVFSADARPGRTRVAYLGFLGKRKGENMIVDEFMPNSKVANYPIQVGDILTSFEGLSLRNYVMDVLSKNRNLGQDEATITALTNDITFRFAYNHAIPTEEYINIGVKRGDQTLVVQVPWIVQDYYDFVQQLSSTHVQYGQRLAQLAKGHYENLPKKTQVFIHSLSEGKDPFKGHRFDSFINFDVSNPLTSKFLRAALMDSNSQCDSSKLKPHRNIPEFAIMVPNSCTYPAYISRLNDKGVADWKGTNLVGYVFIPDFSAPEESVAEFQSTLGYFVSHGVTSLLIDTIDNGGGSLHLGTALAQALSSKKLELPTIQFRTNDAWLDEFQDMSMDAHSDIERQLYRTAYNKLLAAKKIGHSLSQAFDLTSLFPYAFKPNTTITSPLKLTLLVNEMCASMCDIFAGMLQDNHLATLLGTKTMGAGGNVNMEYVAPNSHFAMTQTGSLLIRSNGQYIENIGITPDVPFDVSTSSDTKYDAVIAAGFAQLFLDTSTTISPKTSLVEKP